jgi:cobalt-zinc-cadmium efflux system outer membrane protein
MSIMSSRPRWLGLLLITACGVAPLPRAAAEVVQGVTLQEALRRALDHHPSLAIANEDVNAASARIPQAEFGPQYELGLDLENFAGSDEVSGTDALETTLQMSRALELGGKRDRRIAVAEMERRSALARLDVARLELVTDVTAKFLDVLGAQQELEIANRFLTLATETRQQAERRVAAGSALSAEAYRARAEVGRQDAFLQETRGKLAGARGALSATWTGTDEAGSVVGDLRGTPPLEPFAAVLERLEESPRVAVLISEERLRDAERRLARSQARPDLTLALGVRHLNEVDDTGLVASASVPLGSRSRSRARVAESEALIRRTQAERDALKRSARATVSALHSAVEARRRSLEIIDREVRPAAETAREQVQRGYRLGRLSYGEYALATREALQTELEWVRIATEYHQLRSQLEGLIGTPVQNTTTEAAPTSGSGQEMSP